MDRICRDKALNVANLLTMLRIALLPLVVWRYLAGDMPGTLALYAAVMATDVLDGWAARRFDQVSDLGKLLDPLADKLTVVTMLALFVSSGEIPAWILGVMLIKEFVLILGSVIALQRGIVVSAMAIGKAATACFVLSTAARLLLLKRTADLLLGASLMLSLAALVWYCAVQLPAMDAHKAVSTK